MKHVHPDLFANAPDQVKSKNASSLQQLNEILQSLKVFTDLKGIPDSTLNFYVKHTETDK